jgi:sulfate adenylyltransferase subunit 1
MVNYSEEVFLNIKQELSTLAEKLKIENVHYIPISAKFGDNVVKPSEKMKWYEGRTFLRFIETIEIKKIKNSSGSRFPVQTIIRPLSDEYHDYRGYAGRIAGGTFLKGDEVTVLPSMLRSRISGINVMGKSISEALAGDSVSITLEDQLDISRGNLIVRNDELPQSGQDIDLMICWFSERQLKPSGKYILRNYSNETNCIIKSINFRMNINKLEKETGNPAISMNDIAEVSIHTAKPLYYDPYKINNVTGSLIFIDEGTNETVAAGMIR